MVLASLSWRSRGCDTQVHIPIPYIGKASLHLVDEFREPAKLLFNAGLARFTDQEIAGLAESWQHKRVYFWSLGSTGVDEHASSMPTTRCREAITDFCSGYVYLRLDSCGEI